MKALRNTGRNLSSDFADGGFIFIHYFFTVPFIRSLLLFFITYSDDDASLAGSCHREVPSKGTIFYLF